MKMGELSSNVFKSAGKIIERLRSSKNALKIGVFLLIINPPLGYASFLVCGYLCARHEDTSYLSEAAVFYAFTWMMAGIGILLAGPRGTLLIKRYLKKIFRKNKSNIFFKKTRH